MESIQELKKEALQAIENATDLEGLRLVEVEYLGRSGKVTAILRGLRDMSPEERKSKGAEANELRVAFEEAVKNQQKVLQGKDH